MVSPTAGGSTQTPDAAAGEDPRERLRRLLADRSPREVPDAVAERRAAVVLLLRPGGDGPEGSVDGEPPAPVSAGGRRPERTPPAGLGPEEGGDRSAGPGGGRTPLAADVAPLEALFVLRVEREGDPWSGHVGLPGGHREPGDADLAAAARRELAEETGLELEPSAMLGRLDDVHPRSRRLPSVAVTPYVAWTDGGTGVRHGEEVDGHLWVPLSELASPDRRSVLAFRRDGALRTFPAVEVGGLTIWGLTFAIVRRFLDELARDPGGGGRA